MRRNLSSTQRAVLRRQIARVLQSRTFRVEIQDFRRAWRMERRPEQLQVWAFPQSALDNHRDELEEAADQFGGLWFRGLGGWWLGDRLILDSGWEDRPVVDVVEELAALIERQSSRSGTIRHDPGGNPFQPAPLWRDTELANDLRTSRNGHVVPSTGHDHVLIGRAFIEVFPWTQEDDVRRAFRFAQQGVPKLLPHKAQQNRDLSEGMLLYRRYCAGDNMKKLVQIFSPGRGDAARDMRRHVSQVASLLSLPEPTALRKRALARSGGRPA